MCCCCPALMCSWCPSARVGSWGDFFLAWDRLFETGCMANCWSYVWEADCLETELFGWLGCVVWEWLAQEGCSEQARQDRTNYWRSRRNRYLARAGHRCAEEEWPLSPNRVPALAPQSPLLLAVMYIRVNRGQAMKCPIEPRKTSVGQWKAKELGHTITW